MLARRLQCMTYIGIVRFFNRYRYTYMQLQYVPFVCLYIFPAMPTLFSYRLYVCTSIPVTAMFTWHFTSNFWDPLSWVYLYVTVCLPIENRSRVFCGFCALGLVGQVASTGSRQLTEASVSPGLTVAFTVWVLGHSQAKYEEILKIIITGQVLARDFQECTMSRSSQITWFLKLRFTLLLSRVWNLMWFWELNVQVFLSKEYIGIIEYGYKSARDGETIWIFWPSESPEIQLKFCILGLRSLT